MTNLKRPFLIINEQIRANAIEYIASLPLGAGVSTDTEASRTLAQNAAQWPILQAFSCQIDNWPVNGQMTKMDGDEWKDVLTAAFYQDTVRLAMGLNGGVVMLGRRTSKFSQRQFSEWLEFLHATAAMKDVEI